jgi:hypothetical protein
MSDVALRMEQVYKKFRKGEVCASLRDLLPALTGKMFRQRELSESDMREFWALQDISFEVKRREVYRSISSRNPDLTRSNSETGTLQPILNELDIHR